MKLHEIEENTTIAKGEYLFHLPSQQIVVCGKLNRDSNKIQAIGAGRILLDKIENFRKIQLSKEEHHKRIRQRKCSKCKGSRV